jgi:hypothetical protein
MQEKIVKNYIKYMLKNLVVTKNLLYYSNI